MVKTNCVCSGAHCAAVGGFAALRMRRPLYGERAPCMLAIFAARILRREAFKFVIARRPQADVAISQYPAGSWGSCRRKCNCLPEIATGAKRPRNDKPLAFTILTIACLLCRCAAGSGVPLPYNVPSTAVPQCKKPGMPDFPASPIGSLTYRTVPWRGRGGRPRSGSSAAPRGLRCRWSRRRSCRRSYPHRRAPWQPRSACRASAP